MIDSMFFFLFDGFWERLVALILFFGDYFLLYGYVNGGDVFGAGLAFESGVHSRVEGVAVVRGPLYLWLVVAEIDIHSLCILIIGDLIATGMRRTYTLFQAGLLSCHISICFDLRGAGYHRKILIGGRQDQLRILTCVHIRISEMDGLLNNYILLLAGWCDPLQLLLLEGIEELRFLCLFELTTSNGVFRFRGGSYTHALVWQCETGYPNIGVRYLQLLLHLVLTRNIGHHFLWLFRSWLRSLLFESRGRCVVKFENLSLYSTGSNRIIRRKIVPLIALLLNSFVISGALIFVFGSFTTKLTFQQLCLVNASLF